MLTSISHQEKYNLLSQEKSYKYVIIISPTRPVYFIIIMNQIKIQKNAIYILKRYRIPVETSHTGFITFITTRATNKNDPNAFSTNTKLTFWVVISTDRKNSKGCVMLRPVESASISCCFKEVDMKTEIKATFELDCSYPQIYLFVSAMQDQCCSSVNSVNNNDMFRCKW